jgi:hypothetical protein
MVVPFCMRVSFLPRFSGLGILKSLSLTFLLGMQLHYFIWVLMFISMMIIDTEYIIIGFLANHLSPFAKEFFCPLKKQVAYLLFTIEFYCSAYVLYTSCLYTEYSLCTFCPSWGLAF